METGQGTTTSRRCRGLLLGLAAGDRNGGPVRMAVRLGESLADRRGFDAEDVLARYLQWWREGAFDTGPVTANVLRSLDRGVPADEALRQAHVLLDGRTAGVAPAHRSVVLAVAPFLEDEPTLAEAARREAALTHLDPLAGAVAARVVLLARRLLQGVAWDEAARPFPRPARLSRGGFAPEVFAAALHWLDRSRSFREALELSLDFAGPANYCPVLVGALAGCRWGDQEVNGLEAVDSELLERLEALATRLCPPSR